MRLTVCGGVEMCYFSHSKEFPYVKRRYPSVVQNRRVRRLTLI